MMRYNAWANRTLLDACRELTDQQLDARLPVTSGSSRELLIHIIGGQQTFALRTRGRQHEGELHRGSAWPGMDEIIRLAASTNEELISMPSSSTLSMRPISRTSALCIGIQLASSSSMRPRTGSSTAPR